MTKRFPIALTADCPDAALSDALWRLNVHGVRQGSRNGPVLKIPGPAITTYPRPQQRVMFSPMRDANPFFHLYESLWMLAGKHDATSVSRYAAHMETFAQDGDLWGAYGWRWRSFFGFDQLAEIVDILKKDPTTRRAVLSMWSPNGDLVPTSAGSGVWASKDVPCNTQVYFDATSGELDMTVCNRSNDAVWGAYGANVVHMSILHEYIALAARLPLGVYHQFSNNLHIYSERPDVQRLIEVKAGSRTVRFTPDMRYHGGASGVNVSPLGGPYSDMSSWLEECEAIVADPTTCENGYQHDFFQHVALPLFSAHKAYKDGDLEGALHYIYNAQGDPNGDWIVAGAEWIQRRIDARAKKAAA